MRLANMLEMKTQMSNEVCSPKIHSAIAMDFSGITTKKKMLKSMFDKTLTVLIILKRPAFSSFLSIAKGIAAIASIATIIPMSST